MTAGDIGNAGFDALDYQVFGLFGVAGEELDQKVREMMGRIQRTDDPSEPRKHHFIPRFLLERFSSSGQVAIRPVSGGESYLAAVGDAAAVKDFYSITTDSGGRSVEVERLLAELEQAAAPTFAKVLDGGLSALHPVERLTLVYYLCFHLIRGPRTRRTHEVIADLAIKYSDVAELKS